MKPILNEELIDKICYYVRQGNYIDTVCYATGIGESTFYSWMQRANEDMSKGMEEEDSIYVKFFLHTRKAAALAEIDLLEEIRKGIPNWQSRAWILERTRGKKFGIAQKIEIEQGIKYKLDVPPPPEQYVQWLERHSNDVNKISVDPQPGSTEAQNN